MDYENESSSSQASTDESSTTSKSESYWLDEENTTRGQDLQLEIYAENNKLEQTKTKRNSGDPHKELNIALLAFICDSTSENDSEKREYVLSKLLEFIGINSERESREYGKLVNTVQLVFNQAKKLAGEYDQIRNPSIGVTQSLPALPSTDDENTPRSLAKAHHIESGLKPFEYATNFLSNINAEIINGYRLGAQLGMGGFGSVYSV